MKGEDITRLFSLDRIDNYELLTLFDLEFHSSWRVSATEIAFPAQHDHLLVVRWDDDEIKAITRSKSLKQEVVERLVGLVESNLIDPSPFEFAGDVLLTGLPVKGGFRCDSIPLQMVPVSPHAPHPTEIPAQHPLVLEFPIPRSDIPQLRFQRRTRLATEWGRALNIFLPVGVRFQGPRVRRSWGTTIGNHTECRWIQEQYGYEPFDRFLPTLSPAPEAMKTVAFSRTDYDNKAQFAAGRPIDELWIPSDLTANLEAFVKLRRRDRIRFLRAATALYAANDAWDSSVSTHLVGCVQAIEALSESAPSPRKWFQFFRKTKGEAPMAAFRTVCERYAPAHLATKRVLNALYATRSDIAHGRRYFYLDELPWAPSGALSLLVSRDLENSTTAVQLAMAVAINWMRDRATV